MKAITQLLPPITNPAVKPSVGITSGPEIIQLFLTNFIEIALVAASVIFLFMLLAGGFSWISSGGDKEGIQKARLKLTYAIIGLVVTTLAFFIVNIISGFFGFNFFT